MYFHIARKQFLFSYNSEMENDETMILVSIWSQTYVEYIISKILFWFVYNISLIYLYWVTNL